MKRFIRPKNQTSTTTSPRHATLVGIAIISVAIVAAIGMLVHISGQRIVVVDRKDSLYNSVISRQTTYDTQKPPFIVTYPVIKTERIDKQVKAYVEGLTADYILERTHRQNVAKDEQLQIDYKIQRYDTQLISIAFTQQVRTKQSAQTPATTTKTYDLKSGTVLLPSNIITNIPALADILYDYRRTTDPHITSAQLIDILDMSKKHLIHVLPFKDTVQLQFEINGRSDEIVISKSILSNIIRGDFLTRTDDKVQPEPEFKEIISTIPSQETSINPAGKKLSLTFDDGPGPHTTRLLDTLKKYRAKATFFVVGKNIASQASTLRREVEEGHEVGNHTWNHPDLKTQSDSDIASQIKDTQSAIQHATNGYTPHILRPPYGSSDERVAGQIQGLKQVLWSVDTLDWLNRDSNVIYDRIMQSAKQDAVILLHDIHPTTVDAAIRAVRQLRADGWQLVTFSQLNKQ